MALFKPPEILPHYVLVARDEVLFGYEVDAANVTHKVYQHVPPENRERVIAMCVTRALEGNKFPLLVLQRSLYDNGKEMISHHEPIFSTMQSRNWWEKVGFKEIPY